MSMVSVAATTPSGRPGRPALPAVPEQPVVAPRFLGRGAELEALDGLLRGARGGRSGALVVRGEAGIGKSALLDCAARSAAGFRVARLCGVESEKEFSFAALQQLCRPAEDRIAGLPGPQADALEVAFGLRRGSAADPFLVGLAVLSLLSALAEEQPVLWIVDDAQWLDQASAAVLGFAARRLQVDPVALLFAERAGVALPALAGLPALEVTGLSDGDARVLLTESLPGPLDAQVAERILAEARGNPLALLELPRASTTADLGGGFEIPGTGLVPDRVEDSFRLRVAGLPEGTRLLLLAAAAEPLGDPSLLRAAASRLGLDEQAKGEAEAQGLIRIGERVAFRHPLVRSAVYHSAAGEDRRLVHRALAEVTDAQADPDRRAWHRAEAAAGADEEIAADLERCAERAHARGGLAAEAAFRERAVSVTPDRGRRAARAVAAATAKLAAGAPGTAGKLMQIAREGPLSPADLAHLELLEARALLLTPGRGGAPERLLRAARGLAPFEPALSREIYLQAIEEAMHAGRLGPDDGLRAAVQAARSAPPAAQPPRPADLLFEGMVARLTTGGAAGTLALQRALAAFRDQADSPVPELAMFTALGMWDEESWGLLVERTDRVYRRSGNFADFLTFRPHLVARATLCGHFDLAARVSEEAAGIWTAIGAVPEPLGKVILAGWRGREQQTLAVTRSARPVLVSYGSGQGLAVVDYATALQYNALGRYDVALDAVRECADAHASAVAPWVLPELIEAAVRTASPVVAAKALELLAAAASGGNEWGLGVLARCRASMTGDARQAEDLYTEAISRLGRTPIATDLARAHLVYGEWLRRQRRRGDARQQLRTAYQMFAAMGAEAFAGRAACELRATGEHPRKRSSGATAQLTPQQAQISQLASTGLSNREIAAQLFLSPRTIDYHLQNIYTRFGITSRAQLPREGRLRQPPQPPSERITGHLPRPHKTAGVHWSSGTGVPVPGLAIVRIRRAPRPRKGDDEVRRSFCSQEVVAVVWLMAAVWWSFPGHLSSRLTGFRCPFRGVSGLDVRRRVERGSRCVRPAARVISRVEGGREGRCAGDWAGGSGDRDACRAGRPSTGRPRVRGRGARPRAPAHGFGCPAGELFSNSVQYSQSAAAGETVMVTVTAQDGVVRVEISDRSQLAHLVLAGSAAGLDLLAGRVELSSCAARVRCVGDVDPRCGQRRRSQGTRPRPPESRCCSTVSQSSGAF